MKIKERLGNYIRVLRLSKKPDKDAFLSTLRIVGFGILFIGMIGFIFYLVSYMLEKLF